MPDPAAELRRRVRFLAGALALVFPLAWAASFYPWNRPYDRAGNALGADFPVFYAFGKLAPTGGPALYDFRQQQAEQFAALPETKPGTFLPALYPPFVAAALRPLARLPYPAAFAAFLAGGAALIAGTTWLWSRRLSLFAGEWRSTTLLLIVGCPLVWESLLGGQASPLGFAAFGIAGAMLMSLPSLRSPPPVAGGGLGWGLSSQTPGDARPNDAHPTSAAYPPPLVELAASPRNGGRHFLFLAGLALGVGCYKPNLLLIPGLALALRFPGLLPGALTTVGGLALLGGFAEGWDAWGAWFRLMTDPAAQAALGTPPLHKFHGLAATAPFLRNTLGRGVCGGGCLLLALAVAWRWRSCAHPAASPLAIALLGTLGLLGNPYLPTYDLILLVPIGVFAAEGFLRDERRPALKWAYLWLAAGCFGPHLSQEVARATGWQPFSLALAGFAWFLASAFRRTIRSLGAAGSDS